MARVARQRRLRERRRRARDPQLHRTLIRPYLKPRSRSHDTAHRELETRKSCAGATSHGTHCPCAKARCRPSGILEAALRAA